MRRPGLRQRPVSQERGLLFTVMVGLSAVAVLVYFGYAGFRASETVPLRSYYNIKAELPNADSLHKQQEVRIGAERAGKVIGTSVHNGRAVLDLRLDAKYKPLLSDSAMRVRLRSAVGVRYLEITPGHSGTPIPEGGTLGGPEQSPVALDEALSTFDPTTRDRTVTFLTQLGAGTASRGEDMNAALADAPSFLRHTGSVAAAITARPGAATQLIRSSDAAAKTFEPVRDVAAGGFAVENRAMKPFADRATAVGETLNEAAPTLSTLSRDLPAVAGLVREVDGFDVDSTPTLTAAPRALAATTRMLSVASPPLRHLGGTLQSLGQAVGPTVQVLRDAMPVLPRIDKAVDSTLPTVTYIAPRACELSNAWNGWSEWLKWGTDYSNFVRFEAYLGQGDGIAGFTDKPRLPDAKGNDIFDQVNKTNAYPGPCAGNVGEVGAPVPIPEISAKGLPFNGRTR